MATTMATTMAMTMTTFGESRCWCQHQRQAHGSSGCGPNDLLMVTTKSGTAGAALAGLDNRGHLHVRSLRESGLLVGHEGYCPSQQREREQHHKQQRSVFTWWRSLGLRASAAQVWWRLSRLKVVQCPLGFSHVINRCFAPRVEGSGHGQPPSIADAVPARVTKLAIQKVWDCLRCSGFTVSLPRGRGK